jgi:D-threonate/D-erythronate kinase
VEVLGLADDLTGALEVGAKLAACGIHTTVTAWGGQTEDSHHVRVIDTETRHLPHPDAAQRITTATASSGARLIYKKTDSTLRGNIGAELGALLAAFPESPLIYAPAYPAMGRFVKGGHLYIHGAPAHETVFAKDTLNPVSDNDIARVLRSQTQAPVFSTGVADLRNLEPGAIYLCDGESDSDIEASARLLMGSDTRWLAAGPAAFAEAIARRLDLPRTGMLPWPPVGNCLVINGSRHELSARQVCHAKNLGWRVADANAIAASEWIILDASGDAETMGEIVRDALSRLKLDALCIFGGDTAYGILKAIGNPPLRPLGEIVPGVPLSRVTGRDLILITKAGGFGPLDVLPAIRRALP